MNLGTTNFIASGLVNGDTVTSVTLASAGTPSGAAVGSYPITASAATGTGLANYTISYVNGTLTVSLGNYTASWSNPTNIVYGTALGTNQNNATASVPGSFVYNPTNGIVLPAGTNTLHVVFTPTDTNYAGTNLTVALVVTPAPLSITAGNQSKAFGTTLNLGNTNFIASGLVNGDTVTSVTLASAGTPSGAAVGAYPITASSPVGTGLANYTISYVNGTLTVTNVPQFADVAIIKTGTTNVSAGASVTYTITATNAGPLTATNVIVHDRFPTNVVFQSASTGYSVSNNLVTWPSINLAAGASTNYTVILVAPASGVFTNIAFSTATTPDPNPANNDGTANGSQVQTTILPSGFAIQSGAAIFNPQTGLYEETVIVTNIGPSTVAGVRLYVGGLTNSVTLYNATGTTNGTPYVDYYASLNPGSNVTFVLEFYDSKRVPFTNTLTAVAIPFSSLPSAGTNGVAVTTEFLDTRIPGDTRFVIEFPTVPGKSYTIIYSDDNMATWKVATPSIIANATVTQWYDDGPPKTDSKPTAVRSRFYRVIQD